MEPQLVDRFEDVENLFMSIELAVNDWKLAFSDGQNTEVETIDARQFGPLREQIHQHQEQFQLDEDAPVISCFEAGQDGFWVHRRLQEQLDVENAVVDPASIEDNQRNRSPKTDSIDAETLVEKLIQFHQGNTGVFSVCHIPSRKDQEDRRINRELERLKEERKMHRARVRSLLRLDGVEVDPLHRLEDRLDEIETGDGRPVGPNKKGEARRHLERLQLVNEQMKQLIQKQKQEVKQRSGEMKMVMINRLRAIKGIALDTAWRLVMEAFGWRDFQNRSEVAGCFGLDPTPYNTGESETEQGISKAGSNRLRDLAVQVAWNFVQHQPDCHLTRKFRQDFNMGSKQDRKRGIVATARKLMSVLSKYVKGGEAPWGCTFNREDLLERSA